MPIQSSAQASGKIQPAGSWRKGPPSPAGSTCSLSVTIFLRPAASPVAIPKKPSSHKTTSFPLCKLLWASVPVLPLHGAPKKGIIEKGHIGIASDEL